MSQVCSYVLIALQTCYKGVTLPERLPTFFCNKRAASDMVSLEAVMDTLFCFPVL